MPCEMGTDDVQIKGKFLNGHSWSMKTHLFGILRLLVESES